MRRFAIGVATRDGAGQAWGMRALLLALAMSFGCEEPKGVGEPCRANDECARGLCVAGVGGGETPLCTRSCAANDECPSGWTCSGATQDNVVICRRGHATPFGQ